MVSIILIGLSLSFDALAVSISSGISSRTIKTWQMVRGAVFFGVFQFAMPVIGWFLGKAFVSYIGAFDHWIAFALLAFIGGRMLIGAVRQGKTETPTAKSIDVQHIGSLIILAFATSIDALAVGLSFSMVNQGIWIPALIIGCITFAVCLLGFEFGKKIGLAFETGSQIAGGLILIGIGVKILLEHLL